MKKFKPLKGVPALTELFILTGEGVMGFCGGSEGVIDAVKGWAADVDAAAGGPSWLPDAGPRDAGMGSVSRGRDVVRNRPCRDCEERKRNTHLWQIIMIFSRNESKLVSSKDKVQAAKRQF